MLAAREEAAAWDLRTAWALRRAVVLLLDPDLAQDVRLAGWVAHVQATNGAATLETIEGETVLIPCSVILSVRVPHFHEPGDAALAGAPRRPRRETVADRFPDQLPLFA